MQQVKRNINVKKKDHWGSGKPHPPAILTANVCIKYRYPITQNQNDPDFQGHSRLNLMAQLTSLYMISYSCLTVKYMYGLTQLFYG